MRIILGSQSPRRKKILNDAGYVIEVLPAYFDEESLRHESPRELTRLLADAKNKALQAKVSGRPCIITADTVVTHKGVLYEKAQSEHEAFEWITRFMDSRIEVCTSHVIFDMHTQYRAEHTACAYVTFSMIPEDIRMQLALNAYNASVAGGFNMSDPQLRPYIAVEGDESTVLGLDITWVNEILVHVEKMHIRESLKVLYTKHDLNTYIESACVQVEENKIFVDSVLIYAYHPIQRFEIPFIDTLMQKYTEKKWVFPEVTGDNMSFPGSHPERRVCVIVPSFALSPTGCRLGKGKGFYDRFLSQALHIQERTISVVPDFAVLPALPVARHDIRVQTVLSARPILV